jgi:hypothetical protein
VAVDVLNFISYIAGLTNFYVEVPVHGGYSTTGPGYTLSLLVCDCDLCRVLRSSHSRGNDR